MVFYCLAMHPLLTYTPEQTCQMPQLPTTTPCLPSLPRPAVDSSVSNTVPTSPQSFSIRVPNLRSAWLTSLPNFEYSITELSRSSFQTRFAPPSVGSSNPHLESSQALDSPARHAIVGRLPWTHRDPSATTKATDLFPGGSTRCSHSSGSGFQMKI
jgi:hypothetical protein